MALLLSVDTDIEEQKKIGWLLIGMDVTFLIASIFSIVISICILRKRFKAIQNRNDKGERNQSVTIVPIKEKGAEKKLTEEEEENGGEDGDGDYRFTPAATAATDNINTINNNEQDKAKPHRIRSLAFTPAQHLGHFGAEHSEAQNIHDSFHIHEEGLRNRTEQRQKRARRQTQLRLKARRKLKDSKALHKFPTFSNLSEDQVNILIDQMDHITRFKNDPICHQHDVSDSFYIIVKGSAVVTVDDDTADDQEVEFYILDDETKCRTTATTCPEQIEVGRIDVLGFFGEGSLVKDEDDNGDGDGGTCSATVTVASDRCELLRLKRKAFLAMESSSTTFQTQNDEQKSVLEQLNEVKMERTKSNRVLLEKRRSMKKMGILDDGSDGEASITPKPVSLEEKGVPKLLGSGSSDNERSLFSREIQSKI